VIANHHLRLEVFGVIQKPNMFISINFNGQWEICAWLADDCYKVFALTESEWSAKTIINALDSLASLEKKK